jgi:3-dehydroquinate synthase
MMAALYLARKRGTISGPQFERLESLIHLYGPLPPLKLRAAKVVAATGGDKKNVGGVQALCAAGGHWRRGCGGRRDGGGA